MNYLNLNQELQIVLTNNDGIVNVEMVAPLKRWSNFWRTLEMPLLNCEITAFAITDAKLYVETVTLSTQDNAKLHQQLTSSLKRTVNWNKCLPKESTETQSWYLDFLTSPSFQGVNRLFVLSFENETDRTGCTEYYLPKVKIKDYSWW